MNTFVLHLQSGARYERIEGITSFVGEDRSGKFGILAGYARVMSSLVFGLARFRSEGTAWRYLALPGALLYFIDNQLYINTRRYLIGANYTRISQALAEQLGAEEEALRGMKESLRRLEAEMFRRLQEMERGGARYP